LLARHRCVPVLHLLCARVAPAPPGHRCGSALLCWIRAEDSSHGCCAWSARVADSNAVFDSQVSPQKRCIAGSAPELSCVALRIRNPLPAAMQGPHPKKSSCERIWARRRASVASRSSCYLQVSIGKGQGSTQGDTRARAACCNGQLSAIAHRQCATSDVVLAPSGRCSVRNPLVPQAFCQSAHGGRRPSQPCLE
jgi:hypothetical protein